MGSSQARNRGPPLMTARGWGATVVRRHKREADDMHTPRWTRRALAALLILVILAAAAGCDPREGWDWRYVNKVELALSRQLGTGATTTFWVRFAGRPDLSSVSADPDRARRGKTVVDQLQSTAAASQAHVKMLIGSFG